MDDLAIIIVNYNTADLLEKCLKTVIKQSGVRYSVIVVDNASSDNSVAMVQHTFPDVELIANRENLGFSKANNQAVNATRSRYVFFLNPDTEVLPNAFQNMVMYMDSHPTVGLAGTRLLNPDGTVQESVEKRYPGQKYAGKTFDTLKGAIAWVSGASMVARRDVIQSLSGFDEGFFLYGEEQDLCMRIRQDGWEIGFVPDAVVIHWGGQSERNNLPKKVWKKKFEAELIFYRKHYPHHAITAIRRANILKAYWRIFTLRVALRFAKKKETYVAKLDKYQTVLDVFRKE